MSHREEIKGGQNSNATDTDHRDMQPDGKRPRFAWLTYQPSLGKRNALNRTSGEKAVP